MATEQKCYRGYWRMFVVAVCLFSACSDPEKALVEEILARPDSLKIICLSDPIGRRYATQEINRIDNERSVVGVLRRLVEHSNARLVRDEAASDGKSRFITALGQPTGEKREKVIVEFQFVRDSAGSHLLGIFEFGGDLRSR